MKAEYRVIEIEVGLHIFQSHNLPGSSKVNIYRSPRGKTSANGHKSYPLTERNYWRAVGMQRKMMTPLPTPADAPLTFVAGDVDEMPRSGSGMGEDEVLDF